MKRGKPLTRGQKRLAPRSARWTRERLIAEFQRFRALHGRAPAFGEWRGVASSGWPAAPLVQREFGSWKAGIEAAGLEWTDLRLTGESRTCEVCGGQFYCSPAAAARGGRFCSQRCMGDAYRRERVCKICGTRFVSKYGPRQTCSQACTNEAKRRGKLGANNPNYREVTPRKAWKSAREDSCRSCGSRRALHLHHVVYAQHVRARHGDVADPRNGLTLCFDCHVRHHAGAARIGLALLSMENFEFAQELLGAAASDYFARYYDNERRVA